MKKVNITEWIDSIQKNIDRLKATVEKDFLKSYTWGGVDELYEKEMQVVFLRNLKSTEPDQVKDELEKHILTRLPLRTSSSASSNRANELILKGISKLIFNIGWYVE